MRSIVEGNGACKLLDGKASNIIQSMMAREA